MTQIPTFPNGFTKLQNGMLLFELKYEIAFFCLNDMAAGGCGRKRELTFRLKQRQFHI